MSQAFEVGDEAQYYESCPDTHTRIPVGEPGIVQEVNLRIIYEYRIKFPESEDWFTQEQLLPF